MSSISYQLDPVYRKFGLLTLLRYAKQHAHSRQWIGAITLILARREYGHG
jgi:hypothetical protein